MKLGAETMVCHLVHPTSDQVVNELISFAVAQQVPVDKLVTKPDCVGGSLKLREAVFQTTIGYSSTVMG